MNQHAAPLAPTTAPAGPASPSSVAPDRVRFLAPVVGRVIRSGRGGILVDFADNPLGRPVAARTTTPLDPATVGSEATLLFENGDPGLPIVVGVIRPADVAPAVP